MFKVKRLTWVIGCALTLQGCALPFQSRVDALNDVDIKPVERIRHAGSKPKIMYLLGRYYQGKVQYQKAIDAYNSALASNPNYIEAHNGLGVIYSIQGRYDLALQHFSTAIELAPKQSYLHNNLGYAYLIQGLEYEAAESLKTALQVDPNNEQARLNLATAFERLGLYDDALALKYSGPELNASQVTMTAPDIGTDTAIPDSELVQISPSVYEYHQVKREAMQQPVPLAPAVSTERSGNNTIARKNPDNLNSLRIEVSNGNGITGMARQVSQYLGHYGAANVRLTNHQTFQHTVTEIYYRSGNQQHAMTLNQVLPRPVKMVETDDLRHDIQLKILLGNDFSREMASFSQNDSVQLSKVHSEPCQQPCGNL